MDSDLVKRKIIDIYKDISLKKQYKIVFLTSAILLAIIIVSALQGLFFISAILSLSLFIAFILWIRIRKINEIVGYGSFYARISYEAFAKALIKNNISIDELKAVEALFEADITCPITGAYKTDIYVKINKYLQSRQHSGAV
ncbi:MAG: hypothetical protein FWD87_02815 [Spirochaetaceae bacterium]|nr:hypothetical protein [Spirochaetaceae bacterium]